MLRRSRSNLLPRGFFLVKKCNQERHAPQTRGFLVEYVMNKKAPHSPVVMKFGGTSVSTSERVQTIMRIVRKEKSKNPIVVVSALCGVTDRLLALGNGSRNVIPQRMQQLRNVHMVLVEKLWNEEKQKQKVMSYIDDKLSKITHLLQKKTRNNEFLDQLISYGEIISSYIITQKLSTDGIQAEQVIATDIIVTDTNFGSAEFLAIPSQAKIKKVLKQILSRGIVPVITGFIGATLDGKTTTLGRGGSDYTASIIGFCLKAAEIQIWTDVDGIMTADPKIVKNAQTVEYISYAEASELAMLGAKVLHPKTILPAVEEKIPVRIRNTFNPAHKGTTILKDVSKSNSITSIACKKGIKIINIRAPKMFLMHGFLYKVFKIFNDLAISVDFVSTSEVSISLTINGNYNITKLVADLKKISDVEVKNNSATVSVVGRPTGIAPVIYGKLYTLLERKNINVEMISADALKINETIVIKEKDANDVVRMFHNALILKKEIV